MRAMRKMNLREANQRFSRIVREVQETGEPVAVYRHGELAVEIRPPAPPAGERKLTPEKEAALKEMFEIAHRVRGKSKGRKLTRDEMHER
jgi:antitoxin (DNA-binding transcriptional repressor) of toxin-antitoxin stability system